MFNISKTEINCYNYFWKVAKTAAEGCYSIAAVIGRTAHFILSRPYLTAGAVCLALSRGTISRDVPNNLVCNNTVISSNEPGNDWSGLPFLNEFSSQLAAATKIPESELSQNWSSLSSGTYKATYEHPRLPNHLVKIGCQEAMERQFQNRELVNAIVRSNHLDHIKIPNSTQIANLPNRGVSVSLDEKLKFEESFYQILSRPTLRISQIQQLKTFIEKGRFCDIELIQSHNARFLKNESQIGVYDLDCREDT